MIQNPPVAHTMKMSSMKRQKPYGRNYFTFFMDMRL
jgi:hypothetical protein